MEQTLELLQKQKQILTQKQIQSLTILAMDNVELDCFLRQEYLDNPMLEINGQSPETVYESLLFYHLRMIKMESSDGRK